MKNRKEFNRMIEDGLNGKFDMIITKSISRFARNTIDTLAQIRKLKAKNVAVYFEEHNINTLEEAGEFIITVLSSIAQEEARSISENVAWGIRKSMAEGKYRLPYATFLGYKKGVEAPLEIIPEEAKTVRYIYYLYLIGFSSHKIVKVLMDKGIKTPSGKLKWHESCVISILSNEKYNGSALLQKKFISDFLTKKATKNTGQLPMYYIEYDHEPIVSMEIWQEVQEQVKIRSKPSTCISLFSSKIKCGICDDKYCKKVRSADYKEPVTYYRCHNKYNSTVRCKNIPIYEEQVEYLFKQCVASQILENSSLINILMSCIREHIKNKNRISKIQDLLNKMNSFSISDIHLYIIIKNVLIYPDRTLSFEMIDGSKKTVQFPRWSPHHYRGEFSI